MAYRKVVLAEGEVYHILNRGVGGTRIFLDARDYQRFIEAMVYYQLQNPPARFSQFRSDRKCYPITDKKKLVEILVYCLMPTHFHFSLKQLVPEGISLFIKKLLDSHSRYFNTRHSRKGHLFEGNFKAVRVETDEQLLHLSRYIHLNPMTDFLVKDLKEYSYSSYLEYLGLAKTQIVDKDLVLSFFKNPKAYEEFVLSRVDYQRKLKEIERLLLE